MSRKKGRAPNFSLINNRPFGATFQLSYMARDETHAIEVMMELTNILGVAGYGDIACAVVDPHDGHIIQEFVLVKEDDGEKDPPST